MGNVRKGCLGLLAIILVLAFTAFAIVLYQGKREPEGNPQYVALGSSFAAGAGLGALQDGSPYLCARSTGGYPQKLAKSLNLSIVDRTCGGAITDHVLYGGQFFQNPQVESIGADTRLVTVTVGGNDIGYVGDLSMLAARQTDSLFGRTTRQLWSGPTPSKDRGYGELETELEELFRTIRKKAPAATLVVASYPAIVPEDATCPAIAMTAAEAVVMHDVGDQLSELTRRAAEKTEAVFVDMN